MRRRHLLLALLVLAFSASGHAASSFWTRQRVSHLTLDLVDDSTKYERLIFSPNGWVGVTRVTRRKVKGGEEQITSQPLHYWKFIGERVVIYYPHPHNVEETLTFVRREGSFLLLRRKSGAIARFKMHTKV